MTKPVTALVGVAAWLAQSSLLVVVVVVVVECLRTNAPRRALVGARLLALRPSYRHESSKVNPWEGGRARYHRQASASEALSALYCRSKADAHPCHIAACGVLCEGRHTADRSDSVCHTELPVSVLQMFADRGLHDEEPGDDVLVRQAHALRTDQAAQARTARSPWA